MKRTHSSNMSTGTLFSKQTRDFANLRAELEETLLRRAAFAFGGLSLSFFLFLDALCFSSEELEAKIVTVMLRQNKDGHLF